MQVSTPSSSLLPPAPAPNPENLKEKLLSTLGGDDPVIMAFSSLSLHDIRGQVDSLIRCAVQDKSAEVRKLALQQINQTLQEVNVNPARVKMILEILSSVVQEGVLSGREVCECLKELLNTDIESLSIELLDFFDVLIGCTDHKICNLIFTNCLQETSKLPSVLTGAHHRLATKIDSMLAKLLDRNNLVMPPICSYHDIMIACNKPDFTPHWSLSETLNDYVSTFNCLAHLMSIENSEHFRPVMRHSVLSPLGWRIDSTRLTFHSVNPDYFILRFSGQYAQPQTQLLLYTLKQPFSKDFIMNTMLQLRPGKGTVCHVLEEVFLQMIKQIAEETEGTDTAKMLVWERVGGELSALINNSAVHIKTVTESLLRDMKHQPTLSVLQQNRDFLMWTLNRCFNFCLKVIRVPKKEFLYICDMIKLLYPDSSPLPLPDMTSPLSVVQLSAASLWAVLTTRAPDNPGIQDPTPPALLDHISYLNLQHHTFTVADYTVSVSLNYSNNFASNFVNSPEAYSRPLRYLMETLCAAPQTTLLPGNVQVVGAVNAVPLNILDSLTAHSKMNFIVTITNHINKMAQESHEQMSATALSPYLAPALLDTYARLLCYPEMDSSGLKMLMNTISGVRNTQSFGILCSLYEMFVYRMQFLRLATHRMNMLISFQGLLTALGHGQQRAPPQLIYMLESYVTRVLLLLNDPDHTRISGSPSGTNILSTTCEELNKLFILTAARNIVVSGNKLAPNAWLKPFMEHMAGNTGAVRDWSPYTLSYFPQGLLGYCCHPEHTPPFPAKNLSLMVTEELGRLHQAKHDVAKHYKETDHNEIFLSLLLRKVMETDQMPNYAAKVTQSWSPAVLKNQIRNMIDFIVVELKSSKGATSLFAKVASTVSDFVFRYHIMPFDTLLLITSLRKYADQDANLPFYLIYNLLLKQRYLRERVEGFVSRASPDFSRIADWSSIHAGYHHKYPEHQYWTRPDFSMVEARTTPPHLPTYYTNLPLRLVPILDVVIHRMIELPTKNSRMWLLEILRTFSGLFAYHDTPITYVHNTLFYYDSILATERDLEKRVLVRSFLEHLTCRPMELLSAQFTTYIQNEESLCKWEPSPGYYLEVVIRLNDTIRTSDGPEFAHIDWRYNEFNNPVCLYLYLVAVELMSIPLPSSAAGKAPAELLTEHRVNIGYKLVDIVLNNSSGQLKERCNTLGILLSALPTAFSQAVYRKIVDVVQDTGNFYEVEGNVGGILWNDKAQNVLTLVHSFFQHCKLDKQGYLPEFINQNMTTFATESQVVFILKLVSPFLCHLSRNSPVRNQILYVLYQVMFNLMSESTVSNPLLFVDYMYYIKYMHVGAEFRPLIEKHLPLLPSNISSKLKFLVIGTENPST